MSCLKLKKEDVFFGNSLKYNSIASFILLMASSFVSPSLIHPGREIETVK